MSDGKGVPHLPALAKPKQNRNQKKKTRHAEGEQHSDTCQAGMLYTDLTEAA